MNQSSFGPTIDEYLRKAPDAGWRARSRNRAASIWRLSSAFVRSASRKLS